MGQSGLLSVLHQRGFVHQCSDEKGLEALLNAKTNLSVYSGFDCTAPTLHVGNLVQLMILRIVQQLGYKPIVLIGGATTKIGDPSGKEETRQLRDDTEINHNKEGIKKTIAQFIRFDNSATGAVLVDNYDWFKNINYIQFLRDIGRHFSVNRMLSFESVKTRLEREQNLSFLEFNYMLFQAYDYVELYKQYGCRLQVGGSDQWGNIVNGIELARRLAMKEELFGLTTPLVTTASGAKMGKTAKGAVWLNADLVSPYDYWQFWRNTEDKDVGRFLRLFTQLPLEQIKHLEALSGAEINEAKIALANAATEICHGKAAAESAYKTACDTFVSGGHGEGLPILELDKKTLEQGMALYKLLAQLGLVASGGEAKRLIVGGGAKVNDKKYMDPEMLITTTFLNEEGIIKLSAGKKKHGLLRMK